MDGLDERFGDDELQSYTGSGAEMSQGQTKSDVADNKEILDTSRRSQLTLLGIPQELRDKIVRVPIGGG